MGNPEGSLRIFAPRCFTFPWDDVPALFTSAQLASASRRFCQGRRVISSGNPVRSEWGQAEDVLQAPPCVCLCCGLCVCSWVTFVRRTPVVELNALLVVSLWSCVHLIIRVHHCWPSPHWWNLHKAPPSPSLLPSHFVPIHHHFPSIPPLIIRSHTEAPPTPRYGRSRMDLGSVRVTTCNGHRWSDSQ